MKLPFDSAHDETEVTPVKGGWIKRNAKTGRFIEVQSEQGIAKASPRSESCVRNASSLRHEALKRLANR